MTTSVLEDQRTVWIIAAVSFLLFVIGNLPWHLDDYDQAKQAYTSFQMVSEGRWFYQQTPHEQVATKPPLVGWMSAALFTVTRSWDLAWRLPSILAAVALAFLLFRSANAVYGLTAGLIALGAFGLNLLSPRLATLVRTDMPLALVIFAIGLLIWQKIRTETEWTFPDRLYLFALLTIAMLIKGPIVYAFLLPGIVLFQWSGRVGAPHGPDGAEQDSVAVALRATGAPRAARRLQGAWVGWWPWLASLAVFLLWVIGGIMLMPGFSDQVVMREFVARFGETIHRPQPPYFYFTHLLHKFAPWSLLMIGIALVDLRSQKWRLRSAFSNMAPETRWLLCWSVGALIAMSLIPSKRVDRIFPVIPPLCLLLAAQIGSAGALRRPDTAARRPYLAIALVLAILLTGGYTISKVISGYRNHRDALAVFGQHVCRDATTHRWRYEAVSAKDEGLLLYLRKTHFIESPRAVAQWNSGDIDALVVSAAKAAGLLGQLRNAVLSDLRSNSGDRKQTGEYVLITR
jgi:4-amino-4-deoxy-L-arabinose transferase-like glycosyltransferase